MKMAKTNRRVYHTLEDGHTVTITCETGKPTRVFHATRENIERIEAAKNAFSESCNYRPVNKIGRKPILAGHYLVHNHIRPVSPLGLNGFRAWMQKGCDDLVECNCDFGGNQNAELHKHYRVKGR